MWAAGVRYRKQYPIVGTPDFAIPKLKIAVFCDSHFWHGYEWEERAKAAIKSNRDFWIPKIERQMRRDVEVTESLVESGWAVLRFWEHQLAADLSGCVHMVESRISQRRVELKNRS